MTTDSEILATGLGHYPVFLNFSNLVSQPYSFEVLRLAWEIFHFQLGSMGVFTGTLLGAEGEMEQLTISCSVWQSHIYVYPAAAMLVFVRCITVAKSSPLKCFFSRISSVTQFLCVPLSKLNPAWVGGLGARSHAEFARGVDEHMRDASTRSGCGCHATLAWVKLTREP